VDAAAVVKLLGGIGMFLLGIHHLTEGLKGLSGDSLRRVLQKLVSGRFSAVVSGTLLTVVTQSSTATILTVIGFVGAGLVALSRAIAVNIGATFGTTSTPWMVAFFGLRKEATSAHTHHLRDRHVLHALRSLSPTARAATRTSESARHSRSYQSPILPDLARVVF
jgi:hypothetical protein